MPDPSEAHQEFLNKVYDIFVQWFVIPQKKKDASDVPKDIVAFAEHYHVTVDEVHAFMSHTEFYTDLRTKTFDWAKQRTPELMQMLYEKIKETKSATDMRLWLEMVENLNRKGGGGDVYNFINLPPDVQQQIAERAYRRHGLLLAGGKE